MFPTLECMWKQSSSWRCLHPCVFVHELVFMRVVFLDLDECVEQTHLCQQACENTLGSYRCRCNPGFQLSPDRTSCFSEWITVWCGATYDMITYSPFLFNRAKKRMFLRRSSKSSLFLSYETGKYWGLFKMFLCMWVLVLDVNECEAMQLNRCEWKCVNLPGTHRCICPRGYRLHPNGYQCEGQHTIHTKTCIHTVT